MFGKIKSLMKQSAVYGIGTIAARAVNFLLLPYYSHLMEPGEYGIIALFLILTGVLQTIYVHGMDIAFLRFSSDSEESQKKRDLGTILIHSLGSGLLLSIPLYIFAPFVANLVTSESLESGIQITRISSVMLILDTLSYHIFTFLRIQHKAFAFSLIKLGNVLLNIGLNIILVGYFHLGALGVFWAYLATAAPTLLVLLILVRKSVKPAWHWKQIKEWMIFGLPNLPSMIFIMAVEFSDRKWIEHFLDSEDVGVYSAGYCIGMLMNMIAQAFRFAWQPFFMQTARDDDARQTFARILTYYIGFTGWVWLAAVFFLGDILKIDLPGIGPVIDERYWACFSVFPVIMLAHIFNGIYANFMVGVYLKKKTIMIPLVIGVAAVVNIVGNGLLIPVFGYMASAWLTVASYVLMAGLMYLYIAPRYQVPYEWQRIGRIAISIFVAWGISSAFAVKGGNWAELFLILATPALWWRYVLLPEERMRIRNRLFRSTGSL